MNRGYMEVQINNKHYYVHRYVAEQMLGRPLKITEVVHHIDHDRTNNTPENLMVFKTTRDHSLFHSGFDIRKEGDVWVAVDDAARDENGKQIYICPRCKTNYKARRSIMCEKCRNEIYAEKSMSLDKDTLRSLILKYPFLTIGKMYNVSDNAIRKWCKKYGLPTRRAEVKELRKEMEIVYGKTD